MGEGTGGGAHFSLEGRGPLAPRRTAPDHHRHNHCITKCHLLDGVCSNKADVQQERKRKLETIRMTYIQ